MEDQKFWELSTHPKDVSRVLLYSTRNISQHVSQCQRYEFEAVIAEASDVEFIAPKRAAKRHEGPLARYIKRITRPEEPLIEGDLRIDKEYDLFVAMLQGPWDIRYVQPVKGLREKCRKLVCLFDEFWLDDISRLSTEELDFLRGFDHIFSYVESSRELIERVIHKPFHFMPAGVDTLAFCPCPGFPSRCIDVFCMGRRPPGIHGTLLAGADKTGMFYVYDTVSNFSVIDPMEHRNLIANTIKRSQYFIAYPGKFDQVESQVVLGNRYFEGAAGGAILLGQGGENTPYERYFDWPDAVFSTPMDGSQIVELIAELNGQPERVNRIRRDSVVNSLLRHDWVYRWREILETVGLPISRGIAQREDRLRQVADQISKGALV